MPILAVLLLAVSSLFPTGDVPKQAAQTTHIIRQDGGQCSATAINSDELLTAEHCLHNNVVLNVDGKDYAIVKVELDHADHAKIWLKDVKFPAWALLSRQPVEQGDEVFVWGNPAGMVSMFRSGRFSGVDVINGQEVLLFDLNGWFGDSGSAIFNTKGEIVAVVSILRTESGRDPRSGVFKLTGALPFKFPK